MQPVAKNRGLFSIYRKDLVAVISKYFAINPNDIKMGLEMQGNYEVLEVNIVLHDVH